MNKKIESTFFDEFESKYGDYDVLGGLAYSRLLKRFEETMSPHRGERCIDLGCGTGAFTRRLNKFGLRLTGVDISPGCIGWAKKSSTNEDYVVGDLMNTTFEDNYADIIVYSGVLHHIDQTSERVRALREGLRILKPNGRLFAYDPNRRSPSMWLYRSPQSPLYSAKGKTENEVLLGAEDLASELKSAGYTGITVQGLSGTTFRFVESRVARCLLPLYNCYEILMMVSPFQKRFGTFLVSTASKPQGPSQ
ncbi:MAG: class I SAM-dependent methyltransferase [Verrucomicrobia bacterium]|nr:class I SAM-dependent methyltransferase [Verrucomicrobiota bacterium]